MDENSIKWMNFVTVFIIHNMEYSKISVLLRLPKCKRRVTEGALKSYHLNEVFTLVTKGHG